MRDAEYEFGISSRGRGWLAWEYVPVLLASGLVIAAALSGDFISPAPVVRVLIVIGAAALSYLGYRSMKTALNRGPLLRLSADGIEERSFGFGLIPWAEILGVHPIVENRRGSVSETLYLRVPDPRAYLDRLSVFQRLGLPLLAFRRRLIPLELTYLDVAMDDLVEIIETFKPGLRIG